MKDFKFSKEERKELKALAPSVEWFSRYPYFHNLIDRIETIIQSRVDLDGWVKVEDRLPEKRTDVIGYANEEIDILYYDSEGLFYLLSYDERKHPSHWQPLPNPPKQ